MLQAKAMQDPEIQNILSDPVMRQVRTEKYWFSVAVLVMWFYLDSLLFIWCTKTVGCGQVLIDFQENPKAAQEHMKNPMVMNKIQKLVTAGIVQIR